MLRLERHSEQEVRIYREDLHLLSYCWDQTKPYIHPLNTPSGHTLSLLNPYDHVWHLGLFFSWKYVNGVNFWEETQGSCVSQCDFIARVNGRDIVLETRNEWRTAQLETLLDESRMVRFAEGSDHYLIDFDMSFASRWGEVILDRTDPKVQPWGGYAGLSFRPVRAMFHEADVLNSEGLRGMESDGAPAKWARYAGKLDGRKKPSGGVAIIDHPENPRYPSTFYTRDNSRHFGFLAASFIYHEPYVLKAEETLRLRYRVVVHDGILDHERLERLHEQYVKQDDAAGTKAGG